MKIVVPQGQGKLKDQRGRGEQTNRYHAETREPAILLNIIKWNHGLKLKRPVPCFMPVNKNTIIMSM